MNATITKTANVAIVVGSALSLGALKTPVAVPTATRNTQNIAATRNAVIGAGRLRPWGMTAMPVDMVEVERVLTEFVNDRPISPIEHPNRLRAGIDAAIDGLNDWQNPKPNNVAVMLRALLSVGSESDE